MRYDDHLATVILNYKFWHFSVLVRTVNDTLIFKNYSGWRIQIVVEVSVSKSSARCVWNGQNFPWSRPTKFPQPNGYGSLSYQSHNWSRSGDILRSTILTEMADWHGMSFGEWQENQKYRTLDWGKQATVSVAVETIAWHSSNSSICLPVLRNWLGVLDWTLNNFFDYLN